MQTKTTPIKTTTPYGALYIVVSRAERHSYHVTGRGNVTDLRPFLRVASDSTFEADPNAKDHWTIRRRSYGVHYSIYFEDRTHIQYAATDRQGERWHYNGAPYRGGFRNDMRNPVEFHTKTWVLMWDAVTGALDAFAEQHPGWQDLSRYLLIRSEQAGHEFNATRLRSEAAECDAKALKSVGEAAYLRDRVPDDLLALIPADGT